VNKLFNGLCFVGIGGILGANGLGPNTPEFWAILALSVGIDISSAMKERAHSNKVDNLKQYG